jgi:hypothetical protein
MLLSAEVKVIYEIPEWVIGESVPDGKRQFVYHEWPPRFRGEIVDNEIGGCDVINVEWFDAPGADAQKIATLMRRAGEAINDYDDNLE